MADGFRLTCFARPDGAVDFLFMPQDYSPNFFASIDTAIMGRKTYDKSREMGGGSDGTSMKTYVFSRSLLPGEREGCTFVNQSLSVLSRKFANSVARTSA